MTSRATALNRRATLWFETNPQLMGQQDELIRSEFQGVVERAGRRVTVQGAAGLADGEPALLLVRPELIEPLNAANGTLNGDLTLTGRVEVQTFLGATTRLLVREVRQGDENQSVLPSARRLAVDVPSAAAGNWPAGSEVAVRIPVGSSRVIADRSAVSPAPSTGSTTGPAAPPA